MTFDEAFDDKEILFIILLGLNSSYLIFSYFTPIWRPVHHDDLTLFLFAFLFQHNLSTGSYWETCN